MSGTISNNMAGPILLTDQTNPFTITNTGTVTSTGTGVDAIDGGTGTWTIGNAGVILSSGGNGVLLAGAGVISNSGTINASTPTGAGLYLGGGGTITNTATGRISGGKSGIFAGATATVTNYGGIAGQANIGIVLGFGGTVINGTGGSISGYDSAVYFRRYGTGTLTNSGTIGITGTSSAVILGLGGYVANKAGGTITGGSTGVAVYGTGGPTRLVNSGSLQGNSGVYFRAGGTVTNYGRISATEYAAVGFRDVTGQVFNAPGASLVGSYGGIYFLNAVGTVTNSGNIYETGLVPGLDAGYGIFLTVGGQVTNTSSGSISAKRVGVYSRGAPGTLINYGRIAANYGAGFIAGGYIRNGSTGTMVAGRSGLVIQGGAGTVINFGSISGTDTNTVSTGVNIWSGGSVRNNPGASIFGDTYGVYVKGAVGTVTNYGTISGGGVFISVGGNVTNGSSGIISGGTFGVFVDVGGTGTVTNSGLIEGYHGIYFRSGGGVITNSGTVTGTVGQGVRLTTGSTLINAGRIIGGGGVAVSFSGTDGNRLILDPGGSFQGNVVNHSGVMELAVGNGAAATLTSFSETFKDFGTLQFDSGAQWTVEDLAGALPATITGFNPSATLIIDSFAAVSDTFTGSGLVLTDAGNNHFTLGIQGNFATSDFIIASANGGTGTQVTEARRQADASRDFNNDGRSDLALHNISSGAFAVWEMNGSVIASGQFVTSNGNEVALDSSWSIGGIGDFNGDGNADFLLRNTNGSFVDWTMNGGTINGAQSITSNGSTVALDSSWSVAGVADFDGNAKADILLRNGNGSFVAWTMDGAAITGAQSLTFNGSPVSLDPSWSVAGLGDFDGDAKADLLLRNTNGSLTEWTLNGAAITDARNLTSNGTAIGLDGTWSVLGTGDFNGDGKADILLHNTNGSFVEWTMNVSAITSAAQLVFQGNPVTLDSSWTFADIGDYNGDSKADILLRNTNGSFVDWTMNGATITAADKLTFQGSPVLLDGNWHT